MTPGIFDLRNRCSSNSVGPKAAALSELSQLLPVPAGICVSRSVFEEEFPPAKRAKLVQILARIRETVGSRLGDVTADLVAIQHSLTLSEKSALNIRRAIELGRLSPPFAVRSSAAGEDSNRDSFAGIYQSSLNVDSQNVIDAVLATWRSYYSLPSVVARIRSGDYSAEPRMGVIVQEMVQAQVAGVAIAARDGSVVLQFTEGLADALVSGIEVGQALRVSKEQVDVVGDTFPPVLGAIRRAQQWLEGEADVEWAWDGTSAWILQTRPVSRSARSTSGPVWIAASLYGADLPPELELEGCARIYRNYKIKRQSIFELAERSGCRTPQGLVVRFNHQGALQEAEDALRHLGVGDEGSVVIDSGEELRQQILTKRDAPRFIAALNTSVIPMTSILRPFVQGEYGAISRLTQSSSCEIEYTPDGLLALNRGTAGRVRRIVIDTPLPTQQELPSVLAQHLPALVAATNRIDAARPGIQLEWVLEDSRDPLLVDYSLQSSSEVVAQASALSSGLATGESYFLDDCAILRELSEAPIVSVDSTRDVSGYEYLADLVQKIDAIESPIVFCDRPYAILSILIGHVAGFVFEEASALCHLAILLREARTPAIASHRIAELRSGDRVSIAGAELIIESRHV